MLVVMLLDCYDLNVQVDFSMLLYACYFARECHCFSPSRKEQGMFLSCLVFNYGIVSFVSLDFVFLSCSVDCSVVVQHYYL